MADQISPPDRSNNWIRSIRPAGPIGVIVVLGAMLIILVVEPAIGWILLPSVVLGGVVAFTLHHSKLGPTKAGELERAEIQLAKIPVTGVMGLVFTVGMMVVLFAALPEVRLFLLVALPVGVLVGIALYRFRI